MRPTKLPRFILCAFMASTCLSMTGCGGKGDQRKSGTLVSPIDAVENAGEKAGKAEDAKKISKKK